MATRLYGVATTAAPITPSFDAGWASTTGAVRRNLSRSKAAATETRAGVAVTSGAGNETLAFQLISDPLTAQSVSGTVTIMTQGRELATTDNIQARVRCVKIISNDGSTVRGTCLTLGNHSVTTELTTSASLASYQAANATAITTVSAQAGDRILVELGYGMTTTGTSPQYDMLIGGNGTDASTTDASTTGTVPWIEFSANLVFQQEIDGSLAVTADRSASAAVALPGGQTLVDVYTVDTGGATSTATLETVNFTPADGELIVVKLSTWDSTVTMSTPQGGSLTYTQQKDVTAASHTRQTIYTAPVATSPGSMTVLSFPDNTGMYSMVVERWANTQLAGTPATNGSPTTGISSTPSSPITTTAANSVVTWCSGDWTANNPSTRAYRQSDIEEFVYDVSTGSNTVQYYAYAVIASPSTVNIGLTAPTGQTWAVAALELQPVSTGANIDGTLAVTASRTATAASTKSVSATSAITAGLTATASVVKSVSGSLTVTESATTTAQVDKPIGASLTATFSSSATANVGVVASLAVTAGFTAAAQSIKSTSGSLGITASRTATVDAPRNVSGSLSITATQSATDSVTKPIDSSLTITFDGNAAIDLQGQKTIVGQLDITTGLTGDIAVVRGASAALTVTTTLSGSVVKQKDIAGALVVTESGVTAAQVSKGVSGALTVTGSTSTVIQAVKAVLAALGIDAVIDASAEAINIGLPPDYVITKEDGAFTIISGSFIMKATHSQKVIVSIREDDVVT